MNKQLKNEKWVRITIHYSDGTHNKIKLEKGLFSSHISSTLNDKFDKFTTVTEFTSDLRSQLRKYFNIGQR